MKKYLLLICFFAAAVFSCFGQKIVKVEKVNDSSTHIIGSNFEGVIFTKDHFNTEMLSIYNDDKPINKEAITDLTAAEVLIAEKALRKKLDEVLIEYPNAVYNVNFVKKHLKKYLRQYIGYTNDKQEKIVYINCFWKKDALETEDLYNRIKSKLPGWKTQFYVVMDGGNYYWRIQINITNGKAFGFGVNGSA